MRSMLLLTLATLPYLLTSCASAPSKFESPPTSRPALGKVSASALATPVPLPADTGSSVTSIISLDTNVVRELAIDCQRQVGKLLDIAWPLVQAHVLDVTPDPPAATPP